jgi:hypothetical protein
MKKRRLVGEVRIAQSLGPEILSFCRLGEPIGDEPAAAGMIFHFQYEKFFHF